MNKIFYFALYKKILPLQTLNMRFIFCIFLAIFSFLTLLGNEKQCNMQSADKKSVQVAKYGECKKIFTVAPLSKENQKKFLREELGVNQEVNFDAMLDEIKTYGGFSGLCSQLSEYLKETNRIPELLKFNAKRIHSCDGFFMPVKEYVVFCPTSRHLMLMSENKINAVFLDFNFAVCKKSDFYKYLSKTTEGMED